MRCLFLLSILILACSKTSSSDANGPCENGKRSCRDKSTSLYCANGKWQTDTCKGDRGCYEDKGMVSCDITANVDGDVCPAAMDGFGACRADRKSRAVCKSGKYVVEKCKGEEGCTMQGAGMTSCDRGAPDVGDNCTTDKVQACASGGKQAVACKDGKFVLLQKCPGAAGCKEQGGGLVSCDPNGAFAAGDACHFISMVCTEDGKSLLECKDGKFNAGKECPGEGRCKGVECDSGYGDVGADCASGTHVCSNDKKSLLACKPVPKSDDGAMKFAVEKSCKAGCTPKDGKLECL